MPGSAQISRVTSEGLAANFFQIAPRWFVIVIVLLLVSRNCFNIAADIRATGDRPSALEGHSALMALQLWRF